VGKRDLSLDVAEGSRVPDLIAMLQRDYPALSAELDQSPPTIFIEDAEVDSDSPLIENARVHFVWPVAGG
jgi:molybdopterin converting factor small subunit